jgi:hypothetical protein
MPSRRQFLAASASAGLAKCLPLNAAETEVTPDIVRLHGDIEPVVRLIENTAREKCFEMMVEQLRRGLPYRKFMAALFLAGIRNVSPQPPGFGFHCVFVVHAAHQLSLDAPVEDRLLPLFWALDAFKESQMRDATGGSDFHMRPVSGKLPSGTAAWKEFHAAMNDWDEERADRAIVAVVRSSSAHEVVKQLWQYGARDYRNIGHKAIFVANTWRTLQTIGWQHAEPALRSLVLGLLDYGRNERVNGYALEDQSYANSAELAARHASRFRRNAEDATRATTSTQSLLDVMRSGKSIEACDLALRQLQSEQAGTTEIWDAIHLAAGELIMRQPGIYGIHTVTSTSALRYAFETAADQKTRLLILMQGIGWMSQFKNFMAGTKKGLNDTKITNLVPAEATGNGEATINEVLSLVGNDAPSAARLAMRCATNQAGFARSARRLILRKGNEPHDFKYPISIFEDFHRVSPIWRPHMLATATYNLVGATRPDSPVMNRAKDALLMTTD